MASKSHWSHEHTGSGEMMMMMTTTTTMMMITSLARMLLTERFWRRAWKRLWEWLTQTNVDWDASLVWTRRSRSHHQGLSRAVTRPGPRTSHDPPPVSHDYTALTRLADVTGLTEIDRWRAKHADRLTDRQMNRVTDRHNEDRPQTY